MLKVIIFLQLVTIVILLVGFHRSRRRNFMTTLKLDAIEAEIERTNDIEEGALLLIDTLAAEIASLKSVPQQDLQPTIDALTDKLAARRSELAAKIIANTPADPATGGEDNTAKDTAAPAGDGGQS